MNKTATKTKNLDLFEQALQQPLTHFIQDKMDDMKAQQIEIVDVIGKSSITDYMVICTGTSKRHVNAIAEHLHYEAKKSGIAPLSSEGVQDCDWIVVDFGNAVAHIMQDEARGRYELEKLWR